MSWHAIPVCPGLDCELAIRFDGTTWVDVSTYLRSFSTGISKSRTLGMFPPGRGTFNLDNRTGIFTPLNTSGSYYGNLYPGRHIRYRERFAGTEYDVWYGIVEDWGDSYPQARDGIATVSAVQPSALLARYKPGAVAPLGTGEVASARISRILTAAAWSFGSSLATGVVPLQGLTWGIDAMSAISQAVTTEMGAAWVGPNGQLIFENRYGLINNTRSITSQATFGPADVPYHDGAVSLSSGLDMVRNFYTSGNTGSRTYEVTNATSVTNLQQVFGDSDTSLIGTVDTWAEAQGQGQVLWYATPVQHPTSITLKLGAKSTVPPQALVRKIRDRVTVKVPTPWGATLTCPVYIVGIDHSGSPQQGRETRFSFEPITIDGYGFNTWDNGAWGTAVWAW